MKTKRAKEKLNELHLENTLHSEIELDPENLVIPVIEEEAFLDKRVVESGKIRISKRVSEHEELIDVPLFREEVTVERVPVNQYVDAPPQVRHEGDVMVIPVFREELVIQKRLVLVEELRVRKQVIEMHQPQSVTLRKEEVDVKRVAKGENLSNKT
ncbi:MAG: YsnF/AvaK domain-containing protein [Blastocatellia bacterium]|nr:YsnF/AvaK domain-containing protein [Blastocatellia bacterium]